MQGADIHLGGIYTNGVTEREVVAMNADEPGVTWCPVIVRKDSTGAIVSRAMVLAQCATWGREAFARWAKAELMPAAPAGSRV